MKYIFKFILSILVLFIGALLYFSSGSNNLDQKFYVVSSDSMSPKLSKGDLIIEKPASDLAVGDIVSFKSPNDQNTFITHRIVRESFEDEPFYTTKGDNNSAEDPWRISSDMVVGEISWSLPLIGYPILFLKSSVVYLYILGGFILLMGFIEINSLSAEIAYEWERKESYRWYRKIKKYIYRIDNFMGKFNANKIENAPN